MPLWFEKVLPFADEIVCAVDTSGDNCKEYAENLKLTIPLKVVTVENDIVIRHGFDRLRNHVAENCTGDWVLFLDADEIIYASREQINSLTIGSHLGVKFTRYTTLGEAKEHWSLDNLPEIYEECQWAKDYQIRLFKNKCGLQWKGLLHEELFLPNGANILSSSIVSDLAIHHYSSLALPLRNHIKAIQAAALIMRLVENPDMREGIHPWWYTEYYRENKVMLHHFRDLHSQGKI